MVWRRGGGQNGPGPFAKFTGLIQNQRIVAEFPASEFSPKVVHLPTRGIIMTVHSILLWTSVSVPLHRTKQKLLLPCVISQYQIRVFLILVHIHPTPDCGASLLLSIDRFQNFLYFFLCILFTFSPYVFFFLIRFRFWVFFCSWWWVLMIFVCFDAKVSARSDGERAHWVVRIGEESGRRRCR